MKQGRAIVPGPGGRRWKGSGRWQCPPGELPTAVMPWSVSRVISTGKTATFYCQWTIYLEQNVRGRGIDFFRGTTNILASASAPAIGCPYGVFGQIGRAHV